MLKIKQNKNPLSILGCLRVSTRLVICNSIHFRKYLRATYSSLANAGDQNDGADAGQRESNVLSVVVMRTTWPDLAPVAKLMEIAAEVVTLIS